ncbi:transglycosylase domain-containing protein [Fonticella tunisiensis]|uniref:Penicillin-binding protein 1A n=1 Tax=Fonticella tunisiensis TaxID=1096341 RepID=A0A4R7KAA0_9CLOT|nr:PBP1A family penicillin-binding protein [Fonticella tunisiensis]TDT50794.1 penicillin-binding protein 1A [Fonticella tunisiensis]
MESKNRTSEKNRKKHKKGIGKVVLLSFLILFLLVGAAGAGVLVAVIKSAPAINYDIIDNLKESSKIYDSQGNFIANYTDGETRNIVDLKDIPEYTKNAFIAIEDTRFKTHHGIDIKRIFGALWVDIKTMSLAEGASTITQQLIRNYALTLDKNWTRKLQEMYLAVQLERHKTKDEILNAYLNTIHLGGNKFGVQAASKFYFGKDVKNITIAESALLAAMPKAPSRLYPFSEKNMKDPTEYVTRQRLVLSKMLEQGFITKEQYDEALKEDIVATIKSQYNKKESASSSMKYQWFIEPAMDQIAQDFADKYGISKAEAMQRLRTQGYSIYLTMDTRIQQRAEDAVNNYKGYPKIKVESKKVSPYDPNIVEPQAAGVIIDVTNGAVKAVVGGRGDHPEMSTNRATQVQRQPGSTIKPLGVYAPAIETEKATAATPLYDAPLPTEFWKGYGWKTQPKNYDGAYDGLMTLRQAITKSQNIPAIKVWDMVGSNVSRDFLINKFHLGNQIASSDTGPASLALGGLTEGVTPLRMAAAYSVFANNGIYSEPMFYTVVKDNKGSIVLERKPEQSKSLSPQAAYIMVDLLESVVKNGTGKAANLGSMPTAGKTGTSNDWQNGWFAGITPYYAGVFWIGHDDPNFSFDGKHNSYSKLQGATVAPLWKEVMLEAHKGLPVKDFKRPSGIVTAQVCLDSGNAATSLCSQDPRGNRVVSDIFIKGTEPVELCDVHTTAKIDIRTGKLARPDTPAQFVQEKVFIKPYPNSIILDKDKPYILPTEYTDAPSTVPQPPTNTNPPTGTDNTGNTGNTGGANDNGNTNNPNNNGSGSNGGNNNGNNGNNGNNHTTP